MSREELLSQLRNIELRLRSTEVQTLFQTKSQEDRDRLVMLRNEVSQQISQLANAQFQHLADKLNELSDDLNAGIDNLQGELDSLENAISILNTISNVLGLVGRVIAFIP
jgi:ABC-type transporter Mla subunit MlaD